MSEEMKKVNGFETSGDPNDAVRKDKAFLGHPKGIGALALGTTCAAEGPKMGCHIQPCAPRPAGTISVARTGSKTQTSSETV